uniref:Uncharacterized protein n=1 Tax=Panagrolaimus sp. ES5 TaxID=591445 RepID=A0AC34FLI7_9BILA
MATDEKKDLTLHKTPEKLVENYVKIPGGGISIKNRLIQWKKNEWKLLKKEKRNEKREKEKSEDANIMEDKTNGDQEQPSEAACVAESSEPKEKKEKKEKKRKHKFGPEIPDIVKKERPIPSAITNDFDYRSPLPFIKALTAPQLAIEAAPAKGSLKAEWNDQRNPLVASMKDDDSIPLPFRIIAPTVQPLVKPEDLPPRMINDLVSRRAKYSIILQQDPNDRYARRQIEDIDRDMSAWAESKNIPGRFTGRTGARKFGPEIPDIVKKKRPIPSAITNDFDYRSPLPFIKALTAPQLAIEAVPSKGSLKAEWNDPRNPLVASMKDDDSMPLPFRIIAPTVQPLAKPKDLVFKTPRYITHPPRMINDLVSRRAKYSIILQQDPNDRYARRQIEDIDRDMSAWAESKNIPGRFTGRTGARVLTVDAED